MCDVGLRTEDLNWDTQILSEKAHGFKTFLVVGTTTADEDSDLVRDKRAFVFLKGADDTLKCGSNIGEVSDTTADDENFPFRIRLATANEIDCKMKNTCERMLIEN